MRFDAGAGAREGSWKNDGAAKGQGIGGVRLGGIDVNPFVADERPGVKPGAIGEERVAAEMRDGRFQMKAAGDGNGDDFIVVRRKDGGKLAEAFGVARPREAGKQVAADPQHTTAYERRRQRNDATLSKLGQR